MAKQRIDKIIASSPSYTRSDAARLIRSGAVSADGVVIKDSGAKVDAEKSVITVFGRRFEYKEHIYIMMNKPSGVVSASEGRGETTVVDLVPEEMRRQGLFPAGRLDKDTTGFVLITDDGDFAHRILSPKKHVHKTYRVTLREEITREQQAEIEGGMTLNGEKLMPAEIRRLPEDESVYEVVLKQGLYHQIKRMFARFGNEVTALERTAIGFLPLDRTLKSGECRELTEREIGAAEEINTAE